MKTNMILPFCAFLALTGCASLPLPEEGVGLVVIPYFFVNESSESEPILKYDFHFNDGTFEQIVPSDSFLVIAKKSEFSLTGIQSSINIQNWTGGESTAAFAMPFAVLPGYILISEKSFAFTQTNGGENGRRYSSFWKTAPLLPKERDAIVQQLRADKNFKYWKIY